MISFRMSRPARLDHGPRSEPLETSSHRRNEAAAAAGKSRLPSICLHSPQERRAEDTVKLNIAAVRVELGKVRPIGRN